MGRVLEGGTSPRNLSDTSIGKKKKEGQKGKFLFVTRKVARARHIRKAGRKGLFAISQGG